MHVQQALTIDITLAPGSAKQEVTVTTTAPLLQAENAAIGQTIDTKAVNDLPLNGRDWVSLAQLSAGVRPRLRQTQVPTPVRPGAPISP